MARELRPSFTTEEIAVLLTICAERERAADDSWSGMQRKAFWGHMSLSLEALTYYRTCCACTALVHEDDFDIHPCGPCTCNAPVVRSEGHPHP